MQSVGDLFVEALKHRGPDGFGVEVFGSFDGSSGTEKAVALLVHRRLSILVMVSQKLVP